MENGVRVLNSNIYIFIYCICSLQYYQSHFYCLVRITRILLNILLNTPPTTTHQLKYHALPIVVQQGPCGQEDQTHTGLHVPGLRTHDHLHRLHLHPQQVLLRPHLQRCRPHIPPQRVLTPSQCIANLYYTFSSSYSFWATQPNLENNAFRKSYQLYDFVGNASQNFTAKDFKLSDNQHVFDYTFRFNNMTFAQGNTGVASLLNYWELANPAQPDANQTVINLNLGLNKAYWEQVHTPTQRLFPIHFYSFFENLKETFLPWFYSETLFRFFFSKKNIVDEVIFEPLGLSQETRQQLYDDERYGWATSGGLKHWIKLSLRKNIYTEVGEEIRDQFGLDATQMTKLVAEGSMMSKLTMALNGTMKKKLGSTQIKYPCKKQICSDVELLAAQWASSFLTKTQFFNGVNLNTLINAYNTSYPAAPEYSEFSTNQGFPPMGVDKPMDLFLNNNMTSFVTANFIVENKQSYTIIEKQLDIPGYGESFSNYFSSYFINQVVQTTITKESFGWASLIYETFNHQYNIYADFLATRLLGSALFSKYGQTNKCEDYFMGQYSDFAMVCQNQSLAIGTSLESYFAYIRAYFYDGRQALKKLVGMSDEQAYNFFKNTDTSLFAQQMDTLLRALKDFYNCQGNRCSKDELAARQWGQNSILTNLHPDYFAEKSVNILDWDTNGDFFNNMNPEYAIFNVELEYDRIKEILSFSEKGIRSLYGLVALLRSERDDDKLIRYLNEVLRTQVFRGVMVRKSEAEYASGYVDPVLLKHKKTASILGGTPWKSQIIGAISLDNKDETSMMGLAELSQINTGIYNTDNLREWKYVYGHKNTGIKYAVDWNDEDGLVSYWKNTSKPIQGTDMLGFKNNIKQGEQLNVYVQHLHNSFTLVYDSAVDSPYTLYRYKFKEAGTPLFLGEETMDNLQAIVSGDSYVIVEAATGQTVEIKLVVEYKAKYAVYLPYNFRDDRIPLYRETTEFKRASLAKYDSINDNNKSIKIGIPVFISVAGFSLLVIVVLAIILMKLRKRKIVLQDDEQEEQGNFRPIRTSTQGKETKESLLPGKESFV